MFSVEDAKWLAIKEHNGQIDKSGKPYFLHINRVANTFYDKDFQIVAYLHDIIEDTDINLTDLINLGVPQELVSVINILTHQKNTPYKEYIKNICTNKLATRVKLADIYDNLNPIRLSELDILTQKRLLRKYITALDIITLYGDWNLMKYQNPDCSLQQICNLGGDCDPQCKGWD